MLGEDRMPAGRARACERADEERRELAAQLQLEARAGARALAARHALESGAVLEQPRSAPAVEVLARRGVHGLSGIAPGRPPHDPWRE